MAVIFVVVALQISFSSRRLTHQSSPPKISSLLPGNFHHIYSVSEELMFAEQVISVGLRCPRRTNARVQVSLYRCKNHGFARSVALRLPPSCASPCKSFMSWIHRDACRAIPKLRALARSPLRSLRRGTGPVLKLRVSTLLLSCCLYCRSRAPSPVLRPTHVSVVWRFRWGYAILFYCSWILLRAVSRPPPFLLSRAPQYSF